MRELGVVTVLCCMGVCAAGCTEANPSYRGAPSADTQQRLDGSGPPLDFTRPGDGVLPSDLPGTCPDRAAPKISVPQTTPHDRFVLRAQAPGAAEIEIAGAGNVATIPVGTGGTICVEIPIAPGATVNLSVTAIYSDGCRSASATASVLQQEPQPINLAKGKRVESSANNQPLNLLVDGLYDKSVTWSFFDFDALGYSCDNYSWVAIDLGSEQTISGMTVSYPNDPSFAHYLNCWAMYSSLRNNPAAPSPDSKDWNLVVEQKNTPAKTLEVTFAPRRAHWVSVLMYEDGGNGVNETFQLTEIEIWSPAPTTPFVGCQ